MESYVAIIKRIESCKKTDKLYLMWELSRSSGDSRMRPSLALQIHRDAIREIALRHRVKNVRVFGSALHGDDIEGSDLDLLVEPTSATTLMDIAKIQYEVAQLLSITVDVLTPRALPDKFRDQVMNEAELI